MKKILITGAKGRIGTEVLRELQDKYDFTAFDLPELDARNLDDLEDAIDGVDCIINLAWDTAVDNYKSGKLSIDNTKIFSNIYEIALKCGVKRVVMASSVHAGEVDSISSIFNSINKLTNPSSVYGAHKQFVEALGRHYAMRGLEVICLRFGGTCFSDSPDPDPKETHLWLSKKDLIALIDRCLKAPTLVENFILIPAISNNIETEKSFPVNLLGWEPEDNAFIELSKRSV